MYTYLLVNMEPSQDKIDALLAFFFAINLSFDKKVYLKFNNKKKQIKFCSPGNTQCQAKDAPIEGTLNFLKQNKQDISYIIQYFPPGYLSQRWLPKAFIIKREKGKLILDCLDKIYKITKIEKGKNKSDYKITIEKFEQIDCLKF